MPPAPVEQSDDIGLDAAAEFASEHPGLVAFGRIGWVAKGVVYALTGVLAFLIAGQSGPTPGSDEEASQSGAVAAIADRTAGAVLLVAIALGLGLYVAWRIVTIVLPAPNRPHAWLERLGYAVSAAAYAFLAWSALSFARRPGTGQADEDARVEQLTRDVLAQRGGQTSVFLIGAVLVGIAVYFLRKGLAATFEDQLAPGGVGPVSHTVLVTLGRIGWVGRALMMGLIGFFIARAAWVFDSDEAVGLDGALRKVADRSLGSALIVAVASGLLVYGIFSALSAPRRRLRGAR